MTSATIFFDDPSGHTIDKSIPSPSEVRRVLLDLQCRDPSLNFLADIAVPDRGRFSVMLAQNRGAAIVWSNPVVRTLGDRAIQGQVSVWDGAGVEMPAKYFVPLSQLFPVVEEWIASGTLSRTVQWTSEDYEL